MERSHITTEAYWLRTGNFCSTTSGTVKRLLKKK